MMTVRELLKQLLDDDAPDGIIRVVCHHVDCIGFEYIGLPAVWDDMKCRIGWESKWKNWLDDHGYDYSATYRDKIGAGTRVCTRCGQPYSTGIGYCTCAGA